MKSIDYNEYINTIASKDTKEFIYEVMKYLYYACRLEKYSKDIDEKAYQFFICCYKVFLNSNEKNKLVLSDYSFSFPEMTRTQSLNDEDKKEIYQKYYSLFNYWVGTDLRLLSPERLVLNSMKEINRIGSSRVYNDYQLMSRPDYEFLLDTMETLTKNKQEEIEKEVHDYMLIHYDENTFNYLSCATNCYKILMSQQDEMKKKLTGISCTDNDLKVLALLIAVFKYQNSSSSKYDEQKVLIDFLEEHGITFDKLASLLVYENSFSSGNVDDISIYTIYDFIRKTRYESDVKKTTVVDIVNRVLHSDLYNSMIIKELIKYFKSDENIVRDYTDHVNNTFNLLQKHTVDEFFEKFNTDTREFIIYTSKIYSILYEHYKNGLLNEDIVKNADDLIILSILISSYSFDNKLSSYFKDNNVTLSNIYSLLGINEITEEEINNRPKDDISILRFHNLVYVISSPNKDKIVNYILNKKNTNSNVVHSIFNRFNNNNMLSDNAETQIDKVNKAKDEERRKKLDGELLSDYPLDIYNYLGYLCSAFKAFKGDMQDGDKASLAIFYSALGRSELCKSYFSKVGITQKKIEEQFNLNVSGDNIIDIDIIKENFLPYLISYENMVLTVEEILQNAIRLDNTFEFKKFFYNFKIDITSYSDLLFKLELYKLALDKKKEEDKINGIFNSFDYDTLSCVNSVIKIHTYLNDNRSRIKLVQSDDDIKELSILLGLFLNDAEFLPFFQQNGISLNVILDKIGLNMNDINNITSIPVDKKIILEYTDYFKSSSYIRINNIVNALFNDNINRSQILEMITDSIKKNYMTLKDEVLNKKKKKITPEEGIRMLSEGTIPAFNPSNILSIATFGEELSVHSRIISEIFEELISSDTVQSSMNNINEMVDGAYVIDKPKRKSLFGIFKHKEEEKKFDYSLVPTFKDKVSTNRNSLYQELIGYDYLRRYIEIYIKKLEEYLNALKEYKEKIIEQMKKEEVNVNDYISSLNYDTLLNVIDNKINTFNSSIVLMKQELFKLHKVIVSHNSVISALDTSINAILPLVGVEAAMTLGSNTEHKSNVITGELISLFKNVVNQNAIGIQEDLIRLKTSSYDNDKLAYLSLTLSPSIEDNNDRSKK